MQNYFIVILKVAISFMTKKAFHHFNAVTFSCQVQGSPLMRRKKYQSKSKFSWLPTWCAK